MNIAVGSTEWDIPSKTMRFTLITVLLAIFTLPVFSQSEGPLNRDPKSVKFVTADIDNFWHAYELAARETDRPKRVAIFQTEYLDKGSAGLKDFLRLRIGSADTLVKTIDRLPKYYASIRAQSVKVKSMERQMRRAFVKFKKIYPEAVFPDVYFLIGVANSGGTTGPSGLLVGAEMYGKTEATEMDELPEWLRTVLGPIERLPGIVAHESCHYNQDLALPQTTVLAKSLSEGGCDTIGELISGQNINEHLKAYARDHGPELRADLFADRDKTDLSRWMYNGPNVKDRPGDLGYLVGYLITRSYYDRAKDKRQAVRDILNIRDYSKFLSDSGY